MNKKYCSLHQQPILHLVDNCINNSKIVSSRIRDVINTGEQRKLISYCTEIIMQGKGDCNISAVVNQLWAFYYLQKYVSLHQLPTLQLLDKSNGGIIPFSLYRNLRGYCQTKLILTKNVVVNYVKINLDLSLENCILTLLKIVSKQDLKMVALIGRSFNRKSFLAISRPLTVEYVNKLKTISKIKSAFDVLKINFCKKYFVSGG